MHNMQVFVLLAVLASIALAAPTKRSYNPGTSFAVPRVRNSGFVRNPSKAMSRAYRKFGWELSDLTSVITSIISDSNSDSSSTSDFNSGVATSNKVASTVSSSPSSTSSASAGEESGEVTATPAEEGSEYLSKVTIGGQELNLNFDTGSADLWVFSSYLSSSEKGSHSVYDPSNSSTFTNLTGASFQISYGDGSGAKGVVGYDTVNIGGVDFEKQAIELATDISSTFVDDTASDGLIGLAFSSLNSVKPNAQKTFFDNVMSSLDQPVFTADLASDGSGVYEFGTIDTSKYTGNLTYVSIDTSSGYWQFDSLTYNVNGTVKTNSNASPAIADTGTSLLLLDPAVVKDYYSQVSGSSVDSSAGGYVYPCDADLPDFGVSVGDSYMAMLSGSELTYATVSGDNCFGGIQSNGGSGLQIFGDVLLQQHFTVFHGGESKLGMANKA